MSFPVLKISGMSAQLQKNSKIDLVNLLSEDILQKNSKNIMICQPCQPRIQLFPLLEFLEKLKEIEIKNDIKHDIMLCNKLKGS